VVAVDTTSILSERQDLPPRPPGRSPRAVTQRVTLILTLLVEPLIAELPE